MLYSTRGNAGVKAPVRQEAPRDRSHVCGDSECLGVEVGGQRSTGAKLRWVAVWSRAAMPGVWGGLDARSPRRRASSGVVRYSRPKSREWEHVTQNEERAARRVM